MNSNDLLVALKKRLSEKDVELISDLIFETSHPIGSYLYTNNGNDPSTYLVGGGESTWTQLKGKFLFGVDSSHPVDLLAGVQSNMLEQNHLPGRVPVQFQNQNTVQKSDYSLVSNGKITAAGLSTCAVGDWGYVSLFDLLRSEMQPNNKYKQVAIDNMPPYKVAYIWQRIG